MVSLVEFLVALEAIGAEELEAGVAGTEVAELVVLVRGALVVDLLLVLQQSPAVHIYLLISLITQSPTSSITPSELISALRNCQFLVP